MITKRDIPLSKISWLSNSYCGNGYVKTLYCPETLTELKELVCELQEKGEKFLVAGHTSNMYFTPDYVCENMISTKHLVHYEIVDDMLVCDCGVKVSKLAKDLVNTGYKGFEGLVDLPGTIGGGLYGNAGCYSCHVSDNLEKLDLLLENGHIVTLSRGEMKFSTRTSILKSKELKAIILRAYFHLIPGDVSQLRERAQTNHNNRKCTQPGPTHNLGSVYITEKPTLLFYGVRAASRLYSCFINRKTERYIRRKRFEFELKLMGGEN